MKQPAVSTSVFEVETKKTSNRISLKEIDSAMFWGPLVGIIQGYASLEKSHQSGFPIETLLSIHFLQHWDNYCDPAIEKTL